MLILCILIPLLGLASSNFVEDVTTNLRGSGSDEELALQEQHVDDTTWWEQGRMLTPSTVCPTPDSTKLSPVRTGQYGSSTGDCFYMYWDPEICNVRNKCPLYVYVDGTHHSEDIDDQDTTFMKEMAARGYVAVTVDYDDYFLKYYTDTCEGFKNKSQKIFDESRVGSVLNQLCRDDNNTFGHRNVVPVDCNSGVAVNGWSQGHITSLAGNFSPRL